MEVAIVEKFIIKESKTNDEEGIKYFGRFDFSEEQGPKFAWSGITISARFYGTSISAKLKSFGRNFFVVIVDDEILIDCLKLEEDDEGTYVLAKGLKEGEHEVKLIKRTEFNIGSAQFLGFNFGKGSILSPREDSKELKIEIVGDSISCGFGTEGANETVEYDPKYDNSYYSYGTLAARELNAEHMIVACSGFGLTRNYGGEKVYTMPSKYSLVVPDSTEEWDFNKWTPQIVAINLGTNDFSENYLPSREEFVYIYNRLVYRIHKNYPEAKVICSIGPVIENEALEITRQYVKDGVVEAIKNEGNDWIYFLEYEHQLKENGYGISGHPSIKTHEIMGKCLVNKIRQIL